MTRYVLLRDPGGIARVSLQTDALHQHIPLPHIVLHSPTGLEWGSGASGSADTALSILAHYFEEDPDLVTHGQRCYPCGACQRGLTTAGTLCGVCGGVGSQWVRSLARWHYHPFKWDFIASLPRAGGVIEAHDIQTWVRRQPSLSRARVT